MNHKMRCRKKIRLPDYDYSRDGLYYFTSNVKNGICFFGEIKDDKMKLNEFGKIVLQQWFWLEDQYPYTESHAFVVMPNHVHGILEINREKILKSPSFNEQTIKIKPFHDLIGAFKMTASKLIHIMEKKNADDNSICPSFSWQRSFNDHVIKSRRAYERITGYIENNPRNWKNDEFFPK